ncbi:hypothetical protein G6011_00956 [Alternaria panax]|uniref:Uncharacterized protein n=1 Tax=Alternaria panax TaxID=48097 RepID=A0AAD4NW52_9PLEO|nr:hypothetical protein G6011_00956 [Alternaria panax]
MSGIITTTSDCGRALAPGKQLRQHEAAGLKGLAPERHTKFWEEVTYWNTEHFSSAKWREVLKCISKIKQEHGMILIDWHLPSKPIHSIVTPGGRQLLLYSSSSLTAQTGAHLLRPAHLPRIETASPNTPRMRWDVVSAGPATPLSATSAGPIKNAFAEGGHWASLTPKPSFFSSPANSCTPITAVPDSPWGSDAPTADPAAKVAYDEAKSDVNKMALQLCASRHALRRSFSGENDVIHPSMVRPQDTLLAAQLTLHSYRLPGPLANYIDPLLPAKIEAFAEEEAVGAKQYSLHSLGEIQDVDNWLRYDETTGTLTTILEAQRDLLRMNRERRKGREVEVKEECVKMAWAVKVLEDKEKAVETKKDLDDEDSDDEGYDYGNFARSLGGRGSAETFDERWSDSTLDLALTNSSTAYSSGSGAKSGFAWAQRSSSSQVEPIHDFANYILPLCNKNFTLSNLLAAAASSDPHTHPHNDTHSIDIHRPKYPPTYAQSVHSIRRSNATAHPSNSVRSRRDLSINTIGINTSRESLLSPQERGTRRRGPSIQDLDSWAGELKRMERKRAEVRLGGGTTEPADGVIQAPEKKNVREDDREGNVEVVDVKDGGLVVNGCVHPALRGGGDGDADGHEEEERKEEENEGTGKGRRRGRGATGGSAKIWRCSIAASIEYDGLPEPDDHEEHDNLDEDEVEVHDFEYKNYSCDDDSYDEEYEDDADADADITASTPSLARPPTHSDHHSRPSSHPLRTSSSPTHPPIRLSSLQNALQIQLPSTSPPCRPPRPSSIFNLPPEPILHPAAAYNRYAATSYERQASKTKARPPPRPETLCLAPQEVVDQPCGQQLAVWQTKQGSQHSQRRGSKAAMLEDTMGLRDGQHVDARSRSRVENREEDEWDKELKSMEGRERLRQLGLENENEREGGP